MTLYIFNSDKTIRTTLNQVYFQNIKSSDQGMYYLCIADCDVGLNASYRHKDTYFGLVTEKSAEQVEYILNYGSKADGIARFITEINSSLVTPFISSEEL